MTGGTRVSLGEHQKRCPEGINAGHTPTFIRQDERRTGMDELDEIKSKLAMASSGLNKTLENAESIDEVDDESLAEIETARDAARRALERIDD